MKDSEVELKTVDLSQGHKLIYNDLLTSRKYRLIGLCDSHNMDFKPINSSRNILKVGVESKPYILLGKAVNYINTGAVNDLVKELVDVGIEEFCLHAYYGVSLHINGFTVDYLIVLDEEACIRDGKKSGE